jgi:hypothetical protein
MDAVSIVLDFLTASEPTCAVFLVFVVASVALLGKRVTCDFHALLV